MHPVAQPFWRRTLAPVLALPLAAAGCASPLAQDSADAIRRDIGYLADDSLAGREAGSPEYEKAARYVAGRMRNMGLRPGGTDGAYLQTVPMRGNYRVPGDSQCILLPRQGPPVTLRFGRDYSTHHHWRSPRTALRAPLVFAGYGVVSPRFKRNDYAGLDVRGRIVVLLRGGSPDLPSEERAYFQDETDVEAARQGAVGLLYVPTRESEKVFPWRKATANLMREGMTWVDRDGSAWDPAAGLVVGASLNMDSAARLFTGAPRSYRQVLDEAEKGPVKGFGLPMEARLAQGSRLRDLASSNVIGVLEGSDPTLKHEAIVLSAHLDHLGRKRDAKPGEDNVYNGALDNAAGVATLLEAARLFGASGQTPRRTLVFLVSTAEEKGLVGADYFARHPTLPAGMKIVANVDLDMPLLSFDFADVIAFGAQHSSIGETVAQVARRMGLTLAPDPWPEEATFVRSDHYRFVQQGVPAVFLVTGITSTDPKEDGRKRWQDFLQNRYHQVDDDLGQPIRYAVGAKFALINYLVTRELADAARAPTWNKNDFFAEMYAR